MEYLNRRDRLQDFGVNGTIILKYILIEKD
jgi:hypothetical protein